MATIERTNESAKPVDTKVGARRGKEESGSAIEHDAAVEHDEPLKPDELTLRAERIIQDHVLLATASGLIPGPALDIAAAFAVQLTMIKRLSSLYGIPFRRDLAKSVVMSFVTSIGGIGAGAIAAVSMLKLVPGLGTLVGVVGTSLSLSAFTYAVGKVFQQHFASGGTFIDLHPRAYRDYFGQMFNRGKDLFAKKKDVATTADEADDPALKRATVRA